MRRATWRVLGLLAGLLLATTAVAQVSAIDGVPLPDDFSLQRSADIAPTFRPWLRVWVGSWSGLIKHMLIVENVTDDGHVSVVYAIGDMPGFGIRRAWSRLQGTISGHTLTVATTGMSAVYTMTDPGTLHASYSRGGIVSEAILTGTDLASLTQPNAIIPWTGGKSDLLQTGLVEDGRPVRLEVVTFRPPGHGPFPLAVINHGSTGRGTDPALFKETWAEPGLANFLTERGWLVAFPQRRGRGRSDGLYDEGFAADRTLGYSCDPDRSLPGAKRALSDIAAAVMALRREDDVAGSRLLMAGQSRGGILSVAYAGAHPDEVLGVINFVGGWMGTGCDTAALLNRTLFEQGARFPRPTLWLYGHNDAFYAIEHSRSNFAAFRAAGGQGTFLEFDVPGGRGHGLIVAGNLWRGPVSAYLATITETGSAATPAR